MMNEDKTTDLANQLLDVLMQTQDVMNLDKLTAISMALARTGHALGLGDDVLTEFFNAALKTDGDDID